MKIFKFGLIGKITILVGIIELIAFSLLSFLYAEKYSSEIENNLTNRLHQINQMIASEEMPISSLSRTSLMSSMIGETYLEGVIIGSNGRIIVSSNSEYLGRKPDVISGFKSQWLINEPGEKIIIKEDKLISVAYLNSDISSTPLYHTIITISTKELSLIKSKILLFAMLSSIIFILVSSGLIIIFAQRFVTRRVNESLEVLKDVENGNIKAQILVSQNDEIGLLQLGINSMIHKVGELLSSYQESIHEIDRSKRLMREIIDTVPVRIFWKAKDNKYLGANKLLLQDASLENEDQIIGRTDWDLTWKKNAKNLIEDDNFIMKEGKNKLLYEESLSFADGTVKYLLTSKVPLIDENDEIYGILGVFNDITEQKLTQEEMKKKDSLLLEQSKLASMGEMIGNIAHQWRQPLSIITTSATGMQMQKQFGELSDEQFDKTCTLINENAQYLSETIDSFRNYIKGERKLVEFNLKNQIDNFLSLVHSSIQKNNISVVLDLDENISLEGYPNELIQCFMNIFNNSVDALIDSTSHKFIFIDLYKENKNIIIKFRDNAGGIPEDILPRIFEPYFTTKHATQGTGLGLHMTYQLVTEGMNGHIRATNIHYNYDGEEQYGGEFEIILPLTNI